MKHKIQINHQSQLPVYKQLLSSIEALVNSGLYPEGTFLPSMNELSAELEISKETVKKAYSILREKGLIESAHGKGFYIADQNKSKIKILLVFDKLSTYKQVLYSSFASEMGDASEITIRLHNQDVVLFDQFIDENLDKYDYYIITPHFPLQPDIQKKALKTLRKVPNRKLILLDRNPEGLPGNYGSVFQDFENDICEGLEQAAPHMKKFNTLNIMSMKGSLYAPLILKGISRYCEENAINYRIYENIKPEEIHRNEAYLILNSQLDQELIELVKAATNKGCTIGKDIGIISYNESPVNEIILDGLTVFSTNFRQMGTLAARMILEKSFRKTRCDFQLIKRNTF